MHQVLSKGQLEHGNLGIEFAQLLFLFRGELCTGTDELFVDVFQKLFLFFIQVKFCLVIIDGFDFGEEKLVQENIIIVSGEQGRELFFQSTGFFSRVAARKGAENIVDFIEQAPAAIQSHDSVFKIGNGSLNDNSTDFFFLFFHSF